MYTLSRENIIYFIGQDFMLYKPLKYLYYLVFLMIRCNASNCYSCHYSQCTGHRLPQYLLFISLMCGIGEM